MGSVFVLLERISFRECVRVFLRQDERKNSGRTGNSGRQRAFWIKEKRRQPQFYELGQVPALFLLIMLRGFSAS